MIKLFEKTATSFETNGIGLLTNYIFDPKVKEERNGYFAFTFKIPLHTKYGIQIAGEMIVTADCPGVGEQPFRIQKVIPSMGILSVEANHIFYDLADNFIENINIVGANGQRAGQHILENTAFSNNFTFRSDLANNYNCRIVRYNPVEAFLDDSKDNTFVSRWGGEIKRDKYEIIMNNMRGTDRGVRISNRKNLTGYEATIDYETVVTRIVPQGYDGLMLPEMYVDSPLIEQYTHPKIAVVQYAQIKAQTESEPKEDELPLEEAYEELRRLASEEFSEHHVDEPKATYKINFIDLRKTTEYKDFEHLEEILPWDWVTVDHDEDNLHVKARLQSYTWDPLMGMYVELILGSVKSTVSGSMGKDVDYQDQIDQIREISNSAMKSADGKNTVFIGLYGEDGTGEPAATKIGDLWFKPEDDETVTKQWDGNAWITISSTAPDPELVEAIEEVGREVEQAQSDSATALENADNAVTKATDAAAKADQSVAAANQAKSDATSAVIKAQSALDDATSAIEGVEGVKTDLATEVTRLDGELSTKVELTEFNGLKGTVTSQGTQITQNTNDIKLKANQTEVDTIAGRVTSAESQLTVQAGKITGLTTVTDGHTTKIGALELQAGQFSLSLSSVRNDLDGLEIGARNYAKNSDRKLELSNVTNNRNQLNGDVPYNLASLAGEVVTISVEIEVKNAQPQTSGGSFRIGCEAEMPRTSGGTFYLGVWENLTAGQTIATKRISRTLTIPSDIVASAANGMHLYVQANGDYFRVTKIKLGLGSKALDWSLAPEDQATVTALTEVKVTVDSLTMTVADKADKTTVTQLANQWQQTTDLANGHTSQISSLGDAINLRVTQDQVDASILADKKILDTRDDNQPPSWYYTNYPKQNVSELKRTSTIGLNDGSYAQLTSEVTWIDKSVPIKQTARTNSMTSQRFSTSETTWSAWSTIADSSNVVSQINISNEGVLIAGDKIQILGNTYIESGVIKTAHIADAAITSAKIGSLSADKITAGTLNGGNVNIINLNADNIVSGTISGQNLSINLTSGEVMFTKGSIRNADATFVMDIVTGVVSSRGTVLSPNSTGDLLPTGFDLMNGKLQFMNGSYGETSVVYGGIDTNTHYGQVLNSSSSWISGNYFSNSPTLVVNSGDQTNSVWQSWKKNVALGTTDFKELPMLSSGVKAGLGLTGSKKAYDQNIIGGSMGIVSNATSSVCPDGFAQTKAVIQARNGIYMSSGFHYQVSGNSVSILTPASIRIGDTTNDNGSADAQKQSAASIFAQGHTFTFKGDTADLWANHHKLRGLYSATKSASANIYLDTDGSLYRATSARKYKTAITIADDVIQHAKKVLSIQPSSWFDKSELGQPTLERRYGFIADEFHEAGLREVVVYNKNEIESLAYDRIPMYHNVILSEHEQRIQDLENEVQKLKMEIEGLKAA
ncbi:phage tail spike protein [Enterococcus asini]|uniref:Phage tail spike protein n=1 Tax=Enterococcus asini TaxID=57732 RepID=A0AAW8U2A8_9ENTE|nr:phage tail spike protein [Enterococcus asini]MDT2810070.1 phage tail spike protein [Enterococcus asini]